jgi:hypothetical protein
MLVLKMAREPNWWFSDQCLFVDPLESFFNVDYLLHSLNIEVDLQSLFGLHVE